MKKVKNAFLTFIHKYTVLFAELVIFLFYLIIFGVFQLLKLSTSFCEWYSRTIARFIQTVNGAILKYLPFSFTEVFFIFLIIFCITLLVYAIVAFCKRKPYKGFSSLCLMVVQIFAVVTAYNVTVGLEYNRDEVPIPMYEGTVENSQIDSVIQYFLEDYNYCASQLEFDENNEVINPYSTAELNRIIENEYEKLNDESFGGYFSSFTTYAKPMMTSFLYREFWITGVYFGTFGEANFNYLSTNAEIPFTMCHEIAHSKGVMRENDANLVAAYLTLTSDDVYLRYSGYTYTFTRLLSLANYSDTENAYRTFYYQIDSQILANRSYISNYWNEHDLYNEIVDWINDLYLKLMGTEEGTDSYNDTTTVVDPTTNKIVSLSNYQKIYYQIYIDLFETL